MIAKTFFIYLLCSFMLYAEVLYVSVQGNDLHDGSSPKQAFSTLARALKVAQTMPLVQNSVTISVLPGEYRTHGHKLFGRKDGKAIKIRGNYDQGKQTVFKPLGGCVAWLKLKNRSGKFSNVTIENMVIDGFCTAISLNGNRDKEQQYNAKNIIRNNKFIHIGSTFKNKYSTAAIRLVNSKKNIIENNQFLSIRNVKKCGLLHAIYLAHFSSDNIIRNNTFVDLCGSVIKFRDRSNNNIVQNNYFYGFDRSVIQEWSCNKSKNKRCTKKAGECPSFGNRIVHNDIVVGRTSNKDIINVPDTVFRPWCEHKEYNQTKILIK